MTSPTLHEHIALDITEDGCGLMRCEVCGHKFQPGTSTIAEYLAHGWPRHCDKTMRWWTKRQIDAGEMPRFRKA
jgi:hypothetical protein